MKFSIQDHTSHLEEIHISKIARQSPGMWAEARRRGKHLAGVTVVHINATPVGGGVAELLRSQVPMERALGIDSRWWTITAPKTFFQATKHVHNLLQGQRGDIRGDERTVLARAARAFRSQAVRMFHTLPSKSIIVIHDPQPAAICAVIPPSLRAIFRIHVDLSHPNARALRMLTSQISRADVAIVSNALYARGFPCPVRLVPPAIDASSEKNIPMREKEARNILIALGVHPERPIIAQISRLDPWKNPMGVIRAYDIVKQQFPQVQLVLAGVMNAKDDPEAMLIKREVSRYVRGDNQIFLFTAEKHLNGHSNTDVVRAIHACADVIIQHSSREGFGLTITEAMWKERPVVAAPSAGALAQIIHGKNGFIEPDSDAIGQRTSELLGDAVLRKRVGLAARHSVRKRFLFPRYIRDMIEVYAELHRRA